MSFSNNLLSPEKMRVNDSRLKNESSSFNLKRGRGSAEIQPSNDMSLKIKEEYASINKVGLTAEQVGMIESLSTNGIGYTMMESLIEGDIDGHRTLSPPKESL